MYLVTIEWNGKKPSSRFYRRLHKAGIAPRSEKRFSGEIFLAQEGSLFVSSFTSARAFAALAYSCGAKTVSVHEVGPAIDLWGPLPQGVESFLNPPKGRKKVFAEVTLTCSSCMTTQVLYDSSIPGVCPKCVSPAIRTVPYAVETTAFVEANPTPDNVADALERNGIFIFPAKVIVTNYHPKIEGAGKMPPEQKKKLVQSAKFALYRSDSVEEAVKMTPVLYAFLEMSREERIAERVGFLQQYYLSGGTRVLDINPPPPNEGFDDTDLEMAKMYVISKKSVQEKAGG